MDRFVKNFIGMSIVYLFVASIFGIVMLAHPSLLTMKFVHSHLNMLGWVSMMIFGVGYHILPRFTGKPLRSPKMGELQFWLANVGLIGMLLFYALGSFNPEMSIYKGLTITFGFVEAVSIFLFFYNMLATIYSKSEA
jgi:cbb3-type cytochrome oxidase subunit 1